MVIGRAFPTPHQCSTQSPAFHARGCRTARGSDQTKRSPKRAFGDGDGDPSEADALCLSDRSIIIARSLAAVVVSRQSSPGSSSSSRAAQQQSRESEARARASNRAPAAAAAVLRENRMKSIQGAIVRRPCACCWKSCHRLNRALIHTFTYSGGRLVASIDRPIDASAGMANNSSSRGARAPAAAADTASAACPTTPTRRPPSTIRRRTGRCVCLLRLLGLLVLSLVLLVPAVGASSSLSTGDIKAHGVKGASKVRGSDERARLDGVMMHN